MPDTALPKAPPSPAEMPAALDRFMSPRDVHKAVILSLVNKFVYVRVPKVANSSIKFSIYSNEKPEGTGAIKPRIIHDIHYGPVIRPGMLGFSSPLLHKALFGPNFFRFTFVRNPYAKALSNYLDRYQAEKSGVRRHVNRVALREGWISKPDELVDFPHYLKAVEKMAPRAMEIHISPQTTQIMAGLIDYDEICAFEALDTEWDRIGKRLWKGYTPDLGNQSPSRTDAGEKLASYYSAADMARLNSVYARDFEVLGYPVLDRPEDFRKPGALLRA